MLQNIQSDKLSTFIALTPVIGFAVQRIVEFLDTWISTAIAKKYGTTPTPETTPRRTPVPEGITINDIKKRRLILTSFIVGTILILPTEIRVLGSGNIFTDPSFIKIWDLLLTGLIIGAGTDGVNTLTKYFQYIKDAKKPEPPVEISITPTEISLNKNIKARFKAITKNTTNSTAKWEVIQSDGGAFEAEIGEVGNYIAPNNAGEYQIRATSLADLTKTATAKIKINT